MNHSAACGCYATGLSSKVPHIFHAHIVSHDSQPFEQGTEKSALNKMVFGHFCTNLSMDSRDSLSVGVLYVQYICACRRIDEICDEISKKFRVRGVPL